MIHRAESWFQLPKLQKTDSNTKDFSLFFADTAQLRHISCRKPAKKHAKSGNNTSLHRHFNARR
jgi:hypothetical protein